MNPEIRFDQALHELKARFGSQLSTNLTVREQHAHTMSWLPLQAPDAVLTAHNKHDVADAVKICHDHKGVSTEFGPYCTLRSFVEYYTIIN